MVVEQSQSTRVEEPTLLCNQVCEEHEHWRVAIFRFGHEVRNAHAVSKSNIQNKEESLVLCELLRLNLQMRPWWDKAKMMCSSAQDAEDALSAESEGS